MMKKTAAILAAWVVLAALCPILAAQIGPGSPLKIYPTIHTPGKAGPQNRSEGPVDF